MRKDFVLGYFFGLFLFFLTSQQTLNLAKTEIFDLKLLKNEIVVLESANKNIMYPSSFYDVSEVSVTKKPSLPIDIKTKTKSGKNSIFVEAFQEMRIFPTRPNINCFDSVENQFVKKSLMLKAHLTCIKQINNLPRQIVKKDKKVKFGKKYSGLFKKDENYQKVFGYDLYLEENLGKESSKNEIKRGKQKLFKKYEETSKEYLRKNLFENPCIIKSEECTYLGREELVTIYYDELTDLFAIVDLKENRLLDFGIATEIKYAEFFAFRSAETVKRQELCATADISPKDFKSEKSKELTIYQEPYILGNDDAIAILKSKYGPIDALTFITVANGEFKIQDQQATKKIEHAVCFKINPEDYGFSQAEAKKINAEGGIVSYLRKGKRLPSLDLTRAFQNAIKNFCEDRNQSTRNNKATFRGEPAIIFSNEDTYQVVIFDRKTKVFITAYKMDEDRFENYKKTGILGSTDT